MHLKQSLRTTLLFTATLLMGFATFVSATVAVPHLREDLEEINVRPTLLSAVLMGLHFGTFAMFTFACLVLIASVQSLRGANVARLPLAVIALLYIAFGIVTYLLLGSYHALGYVLIGVLIIGGVAV